MWVSFCIFLIIALTIDSAFARKCDARGKLIPVSIKSATIWTLVWVSSALLFNLLLWLYLRETTTVAIANGKALDFLTGYLIEKSLSIDNLFAFYMIFTQLSIPDIYQKRVFTYGIISAIIMRLALILLGSWLISHFHWILYLLGLFLLLTGIKMIFAASISEEQHKPLAESKLFQWLSRHVRLTHEFQGSKFFIMKNKLRYATPLFLALIFIELTDVVFAFDSIPAIFAITTDPFIVWTSNIFAILGLRALYFIIVGVVKKIHLLKYGIALILVFIGLKMLIEPWLKIPVSISLLVVAGLIFVFTALSFMIRERD